MFSKVLRDFAKPHWFDIVTELKSSTGLSVGELSKRLKMSYMGIKQYCVELEKRGYLDTWRRPKPVGRPEKLYRLTRKTDPLFPSVEVDFTMGLLKSVQRNYGGTAAEKLLFTQFQQETQRLESKVKGESTADRARSLARLRSLEGRVSECESDGEDGSLSLVEYHNPLAKIAEVYPSVHRMEESMLGKVLGATVTREVESASGLSRIVFRIEE